jgi:hypothetical protein
VYYQKRSAQRLRRRALFELHTGNPEQAERLTNQAMEISRDYDDHLGIVGALVLHARIARHYGDELQSTLSRNEAQRWIRLHIAPLLHHS